MYEVRVAFGRWSQFSQSLAADGPKLISGSAAYGDTDVPSEVRVWDPATMTCEHTVLQPAGAKVLCLLCV